MPEKKPPKRRGSRWIIVPGVVVFLLLVLITRSAVFEAFVSAGPSMEPTLPNGTHFVISKGAYGLFLPFTHGALVTWGSPERGEVLVLRAPNGFDIIKRVIGVAGDTVAMRDSRLFVDGRPVPTRALGPARGGADPDLQCFEEHLGSRRWKVVRSADTRTMDVPAVTVPKGRLYVVGDHRDRSNDSRFFGPVPIRSVKGPVSLVYFHGHGASCPDGSATGH